MNSLHYFQPLPQGTTTATLRRFYAIKEHVHQGKVLTVRVFARESAAALRTLLQTAFANTVVHVYVYPLSDTSVEVTLVQQGQETHIKTCNIEGANDILQSEPVDETSRRQWRDLITAYIKTPYLADVPTPETNPLFQQWITSLSPNASNDFLMDDLIDAVHALLTAKTTHPFDETYVIQTTAVAGMYFAGSLHQWSDAALMQKINAATLAFGRYLPVSDEMILALDAFIWERA